MLSSQQGLYRYLRHLTNRPDAAEDLAVPPPNENDSPEDELVREEIRRNLTECLDEMKTKYSAYFPRSDWSLLEEIVKNTARSKTELARKAVGGILGFALLPSSSTTIIC